MTSNDGASILSGATGGYLEFRPPHPLDVHFQCVWTNTVPSGSAGGLAVVPDGCIDITWIDGRLVVAGPDVSVTISQLSSAGAVLGARFRSGAATRWLGLPMTEIVGTRLPLAEFWGARAGTIEARIGDFATAAERMRAFQDALCKIAPAIPGPGEEMGFVFNALKTESGGPNMAIILNRLDVSPRTLRRRCREAFGYGPKTLDRILRFQRFLNLAQNADQPRLAGLAFEAGFSDQAHLTREVRRLAGLSPASVLSQIRN